MIDLRRLTDDSAYRDGVLRKGVDPDAVRSLIELAEAARIERTATEALRAEANQANKEIGKAVPEERQAKIEKAQEMIRKNCD